MRVSIKTLSDHMLKLTDTHVKVHRHSCQSSQTHMLKFTDTHVEAHRHTY